MKMGLRIGICVAVIAIGAGCHGPRPEIAFDSDATFGAHRTHGGIDVDRLAGGSGGVVRAPGWGLGSGPTFTFSSDGRASATFWRSGPAHVEVRRGDANTPIVGAIEPSWDDNAIRLTIAPAGGPSTRTDTFAREGGGSTAALSRIAQTVVDVRGSYRTAVHDASGKVVGWLRVRISPYREAPRIYEGALPAGIDPALVVATAVALDSEIDWIEDHTIDVYRGTTGGPLQQSVPVGH